MDKLVLIGGGGHARVILDMFEERPAFDTVGCITRDGLDSGQLPIPVLGDHGHLSRLFSEGIRNAFVAVGDNRLRSQLTAMVLHQGFQLVNILSPHAVVSRYATTGSGIAVMPGAVVNAGARLGDGCIVNTGAIVDHDCVIGPWAHIGPGTVLAGGIQLGEGVFLGIGVKIIPGLSVGPWTRVGAGAVVIRNLPSGVCAVGVPTRILKKNPA